MNKLLWPILTRAFVILLILVLAVFLFLKNKFLGEYSLVLLTVPFIPAVINFLFIHKLVSLYQLSINIFYRKYLLISMIKFFTNIILFIILIFLFQPKPIPYIVVYLLSYFIFFVTEILELNALIRKLN